MWEWNASFPKRTCLGVISSTLLALAMMHWYSQLPPALPSSFAEAQRRWEAQDISAYRIDLTYSAGIAIASFDLTVRDGQIERQLCDAEPQSICKNANSYLAPALFERAAATLQRSQDAHVNVTFDPIYGIPTLITSDVPGMNDDETAVRVSSFEVLP